jgi:hypothetical protein
VNVDVEGVLVQQVTGGLASQLLKRRQPDLKLGGGLLKKFFIKSLFFARVTPP